MARFIFLLLAVLHLTVPVCALSTSDVAEDKDLEAGFGDNFYTITVSASLGSDFRSSDPVAGLDVKLYDVGHYDDVLGEYVLDSVFEKYNLTQDSKTLADNLYAYFKRDGMAARCIMSTDDAGQVVFENLSQGMYLIAGDIFESANMKYRPAPVLLCLSNQDVGVALAFDSLETGRGRMTSMMVHGRFESDTNRPGEIQAELLRDGQSYDTRTLNSKNGWSYIWKKLSGDYYWSVVERDVPDDLCLRISGSGSSYSLEHDLNTAWGEAGFLSDDNMPVSDSVILDTDILDGTVPEIAGRPVGVLELVWLFVILMAGVACFAAYVKLNKRESD